MLTAQRLHAPNEGFERFKGVVCTLQAKRIPITLL